MSAVKSVFAKIPRSRILTGKFWEIVEEFRSGNIDISAIDSGTHIPSLEGLITIWEANSLPGFSFPGSNLVKQIKKNLDINNGIVGQETINLVSKFEKTSWIIPLYRTPRVAIFRKTMSYFDQEFSMQNTICE